MGTIGTRRRNRNRRLKKKEQRKQRRKCAFSRNQLILYILTCTITFLICRAEIQNILLYNHGKITKALVYKYKSTRTGPLSIYQFYVSETRYIGRDIGLDVGDSIEVVYLPKNPEINRNAEMLERDWGVRLYRKIKGDSNNK